MTICSSCDVGGLTLLLPSELRAMLTGRGHCWVSHWSWLFMLSYVMTTSDRESSLLMSMVERRTAGLMSALAAIVTPGGADTAALLDPAIQLVAVLASDLAAAVEFTAGGGILGLLAILSDSSAKVDIPALSPSLSRHQSQPAAWTFRLLEGSIVGRLSS